MTNKSRIQYIANGVNTEYQTPFSIYISTGVEVYFDDIKIDPSNYNVSLDNERKATISFNTAPQEGVVITLNRVLPILRTSSFQEGGALRASTLNYEFDYEIACIQDLSDGLSRAMIYPPYATSIDIDLTLPTPEAGKSIVWNKNGTKLENSNIEINNITEEINQAKESAVTAAETATEKAVETTAQVVIATEKAQIATTKAAEAIATLDSKANADMDNISDEGKSNIIRLGLPDTDSKISISLPYTTPSKGIVCISGQVTNASQLVYINEELRGHIVSSTTGYRCCLTLECAVDEGDVVSYSGGSLYESIFYPYKGEV